MSKTNILDADATSIKDLVLIEAAWVKLESNNTNKPRQEFKQLSPLNIDMWVFMWLIKQDQRKCYFTLKF